MLESVIHEEIEVKKMSGQSEAGTTPAEMNANSDQGQRELLLARNAIADLRTQLCNIADENRVLEGRLDLATRQAERNRQQLLELRRSISWRLTGPLRLFRYSIQRKSDDVKGLGS